MPISIKSVEGECVFEKDGTFVYKRPDGSFVAYVAAPGSFIESKPAADLDGALRYADLIQKEMVSLGVM
jgi:hypothetical protein